VGDQGTGKSSLFALIVNAARCKSKPSLDVAKLKATRGPVQSFDFEKDNPRHKGLDGSESNAQYRNALVSKFVSHGETNLQIIKCLRELMDEKPTVVVMDEPDMALSIRSISLLVKILRELASKGHQIIASAHNKQLIDAFDDVLSLEHGKWMSANDFIRTQTFKRDS